MSARAPATPHFLDTVPRAAAVAVLALLAALAAGCGDDADAGRTVAADRTSPRERAGPPPGPATDRHAGTTDREKSARTGDDDGGPVPTDTATGVVSYARAEAALRAGEPDRAVELFEAYLRRRPDHLWARYMLGIAARRGDRPDRAARAFRAVLERDPTHGKSRVNLARALLEDDRPREALEAVRPLLRSPDPSAGALRVAGNAAWTTGDPERARRLYRAAVSVDGGDAWSMNNLGLLRIREGRYRAALGPLARALELRPEAPRIRNNLAVALERTGHRGLAAEHYRAAAEGGHAKAEASLARIEPRVDGQEGPGLDLPALAHDFAVEAETWRPTLALEPGEADGPPSRPAPTAADSTVTSSSGDR